MIKIAYDGRCSYWDGLGRLCRCDLLVFRDGDRAVVVACEIEENPGSSITNSYEYLATGLMNKLGLLPDQTIWIKHYPAGRYGDPTIPESFDWVTLKQAEDCLISPTWRHGSRRELEQLIGQSFFR